MQVNIQNDGPVTIQVEYPPARPEKWRSRESHYISMEGSENIWDNTQISPSYCWMVSTEIRVPTKSCRLVERDIDVSLYSSALLLASQKFNLSKDQGSYAFVFNLTMKKKASYSEVYDFDYGYGCQQTCWGRQGLNKFYLCLNNNSPYDLNRTYSTAYFCHVKSS